MPFTPAVKAHIMGRDSGLCQYPGCYAPVLYETPGNYQGLRLRGRTFAHIAGENPGSARYDAGMTNAERNGEGNGLIMCDTHHVEIDNHPGKYPYETVLSWRGQNFVTREQQVSTTAPASIDDSDGRRFPNPFAGGFFRRRG